MEELNKLHERLKYFRKLRKLSRTDVCNALHVTPSAVSYWESGARTPDADSLLALCALYNIRSIAQLFGDEQERSSDLTDDEKNILNMYRKVDSAGKVAVVKLLGGWND